MLRLHSSIVLLFLAASAVLAQAPKQYFGKLEPQLAPDMVHVYKRVYSRVKDANTFRFAIPPEKDAIISAGELIDQRGPSGKSTMLLVEPPKGQPYVWIDANGNGTYEANERIPLSIPANLPNDFAAVIRLPIQNVFFKDFPIYVHYFKGLHNPKAPTDRLVEQSVYALAYGHVDIGAHKVLFQYPFEPLEPAISTTEGLFGVDVNGDGSIRNEQFSVETSYADKNEIVFPIGDIFISTSAIDMNSGNITVRQRDKAEYQRIDLQVGSEMPDFAFTDLEGKTRHLSEFRGKYLMVDFWGVWCGDCTRETPFHLSAYERFKKRGLEILGLDSDEKIETLRDYLTKNKITWPQATNDSIKHLASVTYRIQEYPSTVLLGPNGKVLILDQHQLQGENLAVTLDKLLPR